MRNGRASSRSTVTDAHLLRGCPICHRQIDLDHEDALLIEAIASFEASAEELGLVPCDPDRTLPVEWTERATVVEGEALGFAIVE